MAEVVYGDNSFFKSAVYGTQDFKALEFLSNQYNNISSFATNASMEFFNTAKNLYDRLSGSTAIRMARQASEVMGTLYQADEIHMLKTLVSLQLAKHTMQRWIMANPVVRQLYHDQKIDGYSNTYVDMHPNDIGESHYDYRRATNGLMVEVEDKLLCTTYPDELMDEKELTIEEQLDIKISWDTIEKELSKGKEDPTSIWGNSL
jgi:hypothetical protein